MADKRNMTEADATLGHWMFIALGDPVVCNAMKADIQAWFDTFQSKTTHDETTFTPDVTTFTLEPPAAPWFCSQCQAPAIEGCAHFGDRCECNKTTHCSHQVPF